MNLHELDRYKLSDAVKFNARLNPKIWGQDEHLKPQVRDALIKIADDFRESLGVKDLDLKDITLSGSNAAYTYTPNSDIDLHLVVDIPDDPVYRELFDAKKYAYNNQHNIKISGYDVELYVQDVDQPHVTQGEYSLLRNDWIQVPRRQRADVVDQSTRSKYQDLKQRIKDAIKTQDHAVLADLMSKIKQLRQSGLDEHGEFGPENLAFKMLRTQGYIQKLVDARNAAKDQELSIDERARPRVTYGFATESKDGLQDTINQFAASCIDYLGIKKAPEIKLHNSTDWSEQTGSFGQYDPDANVLHLATAGRHTLDILRTMAHEFTHRKQAEKETLPDNAGETGSPYEDEANAMAGRIMRHWAEKHPEMFAHVPLEEASGYIPTKKQARDPRFVMALTRDVRPGAVGKEANKLGLQTDAQGRPALLTAKLNESLAEELAQFKQQDLFEINMGSKNLRREAAKTGAIAGMEFEMIVPNVEGGDDGNLEPDYDMDERCRSIQDAYDFFYDGDWNSRRSCDAMRDSMRDDYTEWLDQKISSDWDSQGEEYIYQWVKENVDESEWNPEDKSDLERTEALEEYATNVHADPVSDQYQTAYEEFREENQESYDESDWLDDADLSRMSGIGNAYSMSWPHWSSPQGGEAEISDVAQEFENAIGRDVRASDNYHSGNTLRPSVANQRYIVEPDGSLDPDNPGDRGLEFVSPPLPIDEILGDLNKVKAWAKEYGCYTNDSTGLHINISVPNYSRENLDFVKLALLMGDKYVLSAFGRSGNTYAKSALDIVKKAVRDNPDNAAKLLDKMKGNLDQLASKAIHSGVTAKYTSINTKDGHIEFRSPGGDWLDQNFDQIENTLLRFTVAMSAALNPDMYRQEYLTKLYKMLTENNRDVDTIKYFSDYVAGKIPKAALRSFVKQAQLQRNIRRGKTDGQKMWWKVYKDGKNAGRYGAMIEVVATSEKEAIDKAAKEWGLFSQEYKSQMDAEPLRPYEEKPGSGTYELFDRRTGETIPDTEFSARNQEDVNTRVDDYINFGQHGLSTVDARLLFSARPVAAPADEPDQGPSANSLRPTGPGPWEVYNRATGNSTVNLIQNGQPITDRAQAQRQAMALISTGRHDLHGVRTVGTDTTTNIGTQTDMENRLGLGSQSATANYAVVDRETLDPVFRFQADDLRAANRIYGEWLAATGLPATTEDYGFQEIRPGQPEEAESSLWAVRRISDDNSRPMGPTLTIRAQDEQSARDQVRRDYPEYEYAWLDVQPAEANAVPEVPMDVAQNFPDRTDGRNIDYSFRDLFGNTDQASSAPAGNSFSGQWRVMIDGEEVWRFRGVGNSQIDANRIAQTWLQDQRSQGLLSPAPGADIEVVPVMTEGIEESFSQGVAEDAQLPGDFKLMGQNLFLKNLARNLKQRYPDATVKLSSDRVTAYHNEGDDEALTVMGTEVMDSGYIGVGLDDAFTESFQGVLVPTIKQTTEQLLAANPGTKPALFLSTDNWNPDAWTHIATKLGYRLVADDESLDEQDVAESENNDTAISLSKLGKFHPGADTLAEFVPERATAQYALHPDKWESTFYSLTNKDSEKLKYYGPKKISIPPGTLVGDMAIANKFYRAKTPEEQEQYAELYKQSLKPYPVDVSQYRMPELLIPKQGVAEGLENFNGIQLSLEIQKDDEFVDDDDTDNQTIFVQATANGRELGQVVFSIDYDDKGMILVPQDLEVDERFRRQGIAATMYDYVKSKGYRIHRSGDQTPAGAGFWDKHKPGKDIWEQGVAEDSDLQEIAAMPADQFAGGKDMLDYMPPPSKKRLKPLPGGTDLMYAIETMGPETRVQIVDPGVPGITRPVVVAVLNLDPSSLPNTVQVGSITVDEDYRGRGLAKSLYGIVLTIMQKNLVSGDSQTPGGRRNWLSLATIPGVEVRGLVRIPNQIFDMERSATVSPQWRKYADRTMDQIMELGGQFYSKDNNSTYWLFDVVPGKTSLKPAVKNALSRLYGYESDNLLLATWTGV